MVIWDVPDLTENYEDGTIRLWRLHDPSLIHPVTILAYDRQTGRWNYYGSRVLCNIPIENAPILVLTLDRDRSEWIGSVPVQWKSVTDLALIRHSTASFVLSSADTTHSHRWHKAVISLCCRLLCNHGLRPRPFHTCNSQRVGVFQREVLQ